MGGCMDAHTEFRKRSNYIPEFNVWQCWHFSSGEKNAFVNKCARVTHS